MAEKQKEQYKRIAQLYKQDVPAAQRWGITLWDLTDNNLWLNQYRKEWPYLYNRAGEKKPAFYGFAEGLME